MFDAKNIRDILRYLNRSYIGLYSKILNLPEEMKLEITTKCNLNCGFCFNVHSFKRNSKNELSTDEWKFIINKIKKSKIRIIRFTGGEPLIRDDFWELVKYAKHKRFYIKINTNGTLIEDISLLERYVNEVLISLNNYKPDKIINERLFKKKINTIKLLSRSTRTFLKVITVANEYSIKNFELFYRLVQNLNIKYWFFESPVPISKYDIISKDLLEVLVKKLLKYKIKITAIPFCSCLPIISKETINNVSYGAVFRGPYNSLVVDPFGKIKPCYSINISLGNALKDNIIKIWRENSFVVSARRLDWLPEICKKCKYAKKCRGGCRVTAYIANGRYDSLNPLCSTKSF